MFTLIGQRSGATRYVRTSGRRLPYPTVILSLVLGILLLVSAAACDSGSTPILFTSDRDGNLEIYSVAPDGGNETNLTNSSKDEYSPIVSPDRNLVAFQSMSGVDVSIEVMRVGGESRTPVTQGVGSHSSHRWSPESERIAYIAKETEGPRIYVGDADGSERALLTFIPGDEVGDWSSDGKSVVFAVRGGDAQGIYVRNPEGVNEVRLTETPDFGPIWSPNSRKIAFLSTRDGNPEIYVMEADGSEQQRLTDTEAPEYDVSWSPNGKRLLLVSERDGNPEIYVMDPNEPSKTERLTTNTAKDEQPVWSPDGKQIAFVSYLDGDAEIVVMGADGDNQVRLTNNDAQDTDPSW